MKLGPLLYITDRKAWRAWLQQHHGRAKEIWLVFYRKDSGKPRIPYNDAVEEALCFGWIDSIVKRLDAARFAQRFSPRRPTSRLSAMNRERIRRLIRQGKMTPAGLAAVQHVFDRAQAKATIAPDVLRALQSDRRTWRNFQKLPASYKRIRIGWIEGARRRPRIFRTRLAYFLKMTAQNKRFGMVQ